MWTTLLKLHRNLSRWLARRRHRRGLAALAALGERTLLDLGIDPDVLRAEASEPFWQR